MTVRVIEYWVTVEGQDVPEMFCLVTDLLDWREYPAPELAALYKWRWDGSETALRESKASLRGAGPSAGPMLRSQSLRPGPTGTRRLGRRDRDDPRRRPRRRGRRHSRPERAPRRDGGPAREISHARTRRAVTAAIRAGKASCTAVARELARYRTVIDRNRHRVRKAKCASAFPRAGRADTATRITPAVITLANAPA